MTNSSALSYSRGSPTGSSVGGATTVTAALLQTDWAGSQEAMIDKHEEAARDAARDGAQIICFQELFYGPYFCQVQDTEYYAYTEAIPDGPTDFTYTAFGQVASRLDPISTGVTTLSTTSYDRRGQLVHRDVLQRVPGGAGLAAVAEHDPARAFMDDGGYRRPELWLSDGWATSQARNWESPLYWERGPDGRGTPYGVDYPAAAAISIAGVAIASPVLAAGELGGLAEEERPAG